MSERRGRRTARVAGAVVGAVVLAGAVGGVALPRLLADDGPPPRDTRARVPPRIRVVRPAGNLGAVVRGFGDAWLDDRTDSRLLRVRSPDGRVLARVPVRGRLALAAGAGGVWALQSNSSARSFGSYLPGPLLHVDPRTNRVRARIRLRVDGDDLLGLGVYVHGGRVWVWGRATSCASTRGATAWSSGSACPTSTATWRAWPCAAAGSSRRSPTGRTCGWTRGRAGRCGPCGRRSPIR